MAQQGHEWLTSHPGGFNPQGKTLQQDGWAPEAVWMFWRDNSLAPAKNRTPDHTAHNPVARRENYRKISNCSTFLRCAELANITCEAKQHDNKATAQEILGADFRVFWIPDLCCS